MTYEETLRAICMAMTGGDRHEILKLSVRFRVLAPFMADPGRTLEAIFLLMRAEKALPLLIGKGRGNADPGRDAVLFTCWLFAPKRKRRAVVKEKLAEELGREPNSEEVTATLERMQTLERRYRPEGSELLT